MRKSFQQSSRRAKWRESLQRPAFRVELALTVVVLSSLLILFAKFLDAMEERSGVVLPDPFLQWFTPVDFTWVTFGLIYAGLLVGVSALTRSPYALVLALQSYALLLIVRTVAMYVTPLDPPAMLIPLKDPLIQFFGNGSVPTRDLFFSGHTSTMFLLALTVPQRRLKVVFIVLTVLVGVSVVWQHVHFVVDVLVAPFITYGCFRVAALARQSAGASRS